MPRVWWVWKWRIVTFKILSLLFALLYYVHIRLKRVKKKKNSLQKPKWEGNYQVQSSLRYRGTKVLPTSHLNPISLPHSSRIFSLFFFCSYPRQCECMFLFLFYKRSIFYAKFHNFSFIFKPRRVNLNLTNFLSSS